MEIDRDPHFLCIDLGKIKGEYMKIINADACTRQCSCGCLFTFEEKDVHRDTGQYWAGFWKGGWLTEEYRYVTCPVCKKQIRLR